MVSKVNAREIEEAYMKEKIGYNVEYTDVEAQNTFPMNKVTASIIKCANGYNHYGLRDATINKNMINSEYPQCSLPESWEHMVKCRKTKELRRVFIKELLIKMLKNKPRDINEMNIFDITEDIVKYLNNDKEGDYKTSQEFIGFKNLFKGMVVRD